MSTNDDNRSVCDIEKENMAQIRRTNQRGGRCLSIVDLGDAGTLSAEMAGLCRLFIERGAGFLTGAVPGGAGKTTLMAALLGFLPPGERIVPTEDAHTVQRAAAGDLPTPLCLLAHEIGQGPWYAYIWGKAARSFFSLSDPQTRRVTCLHADTPPQTAAILKECGVEDGDISRIDLELFIRAYGGMRKKHRVTALHGRLDGELVPIYCWDPDRDTFVPQRDRREILSGIAGDDRECQDLQQRWRNCTDQIGDLRRRNVREFAAVRREIRSTPDP